ncbi:MAG: ABC transporter permease [Saprospiraceae bacterium]|nr:ABC transporter permease [Saprospiraceae bacterium]
MFYRSSAIRYFGTLDPVGQSLSLFNQFGNKTFTIGGVSQDIGDESDIQYDMVFSLQGLQNPDQLNGSDWARIDNYDLVVYQYFSFGDPGPPLSV